MSPEWLITLLWESIWAQPKRTSEKRSFFSPLELINNLAVAYVFPYTSVNGGDHFGCGYWKLLLRYCEFCPSIVG